MKTLLKQIHSLSSVLHDSPDVTLRNAIFGSAHGLFNTPLQEEANDFMVSVPVPGMSKEDLNVHIEGQLLVISTKEQSKSAKPGTAAKFRVIHSFVLPDGSDTNRIHAKCRNGLLTVHIEKIKSKKRHIVVKVSGNDSATRNATPLHRWLERAKEKMNLQRFIPDVRMVKTSSN